MKYRSPLLALLIVVFSFRAHAAPIVAGFQRFQGDASVAPSLGALLLGELNCLSCHDAPDEVATTISTKKAPNLMDVRSRVKPEYLRKFIANPAATNPGTTMPNLFHGRTDDQTLEQVDAIVHFLLSLGGESLEYAFALVGGRKRGETLYNQVGCLACHDSKNDGGRSLSTSVPHPDLEAKYTLSSLSKFLRNPLHARPSGRMPSLNLTQREAQDIAAYLLPKVPERDGAAYTIFRGNWNRLPNFDELKPAEFGGGEKITAKVIGNADNFGIRWEARFSVERDGEYTIHLGSDDGSRLIIDNEMLIDNDGVHGVEFKSKTLPLAAGEHSLQIDYFEAQGGEELYVFIEGPGLEKTAIDSLLVREGSANDELQQFAIDADLVAKGRKMFHAIGCVSCHEVTESFVSPPNKMAKKLQECRRKEGCLSSDVEPGIPEYNLTSAQRETLNRYLDQERTNQLPELSSHSSIPATLLSFNCYACHARDEIGGIEPARNKAFKTTQAEMGDEGRIPPALDLVGAKLTSEWLDHILAEGAKDRPYMLTRMPKCGAANVGHLRSEFEQHDSLPPAPQVELEPVEAKRAAWRMVGNRGFGCIQCHTFGQYQATGVQSIDMTVMTKRLKEDWFRHYIRNPQEFRKGTRMPNAWKEDQSIISDLLDGSSVQQIAAIWTYLKDGRRAKTPLGLVTNSMELIPIDEAIIYRNFIAGAGSRAIGVGYPEGANLAFDANNLSIALIWQGAFIDAKRHWTGRGQGFEPPKGENVKSLGGEVSFAVIKPGNPWPTESGRELGHKFRGYRLGEARRPTFLYSIETAQMEDTPTVRETATTVSIVRTITVERNQTSNLFYRAASSETIKNIGDTWFELENDLKVSVSSSQKISPVVRKSSDRFELLLPIQDDSVTITQENAW